MENQEQEAIKRILAGDADGYRFLMDRHLPKVLRMTFRVTGSVEDAAEAAQEAFLRAYNKLPTFREQSAFGTWVYRIAVNCALNLVARRQRGPGWNAVPLDGTYVIQGPHRARSRTSADAGAGLLVFLPTAAAQFPGRYYRAAGVLGVNIDYTITRHWGARASYRAQIYRKPDFISTFNIVPVGTGVTVSNEPALGITCNFGSR